MQIKSSPARGSDHCVLLTRRTWRRGPWQAPAPMAASASSAGRRRPPPGAPTRSASRSSHAERPGFPCRRWRPSTLRRSPCGRSETEEPCNNAHAYLHCLGSGIFHLSCSTLNWKAGRSDIGADEWTYLQPVSDLAFDFLFMASRLVCARSRKRTTWPRTARYMCRLDSAWNS